jgi:hypothetical protein
VDIEPFRDADPAWGRHVPHEACSVLKDRQLNAGPPLRLEHARQLVLKSCVWGFGMASPYGIEI